MYLHRSGNITSLLQKHDNVVSARAFDFTVTSISPDGANSISLANAKTAKKEPRDRPQARELLLPTPLALAPQKKIVLPSKHQSSPKGKKAPALLAGLGSANS